MKTRLYILMSLSVLASCSKTETDGVFAESEICYDVVQTKAATEYSTAETFISYAWLMPDGAVWGTNQNANIAKTYIEGGEISYMGGQWKNADQTYYWPKTGSLSFISYSPSSIKANVKVSSALHAGVMLSSWNVAENQDIDFMVSDLQTNKRANGSWAGYTGVPTVFRHRLSKLVSFQANTLIDYSVKGYVFKITGIKIKNFYQVGSYVGGITPSATFMGNWTVDESSSPYSYTWYEDAAGTEVVYSTTSPIVISSPTYTDGIMLLPQEFSDPGTSPDYDQIPYIEISYIVEKGSTTENKTAKASLYSVFGSTGLSMNRKLTVTIVLSDNPKLITWAPDQDVWASVGKIDISI